MDTITLINCATFDLSRLLIIEVFRPLVPTLRVPSCRRPAMRESCCPGNSVICGARTTAQRVESCLLHYDSQSPTSCRRLRPFCGTRASRLSSGLSSVIDPSKVLIVGNAVTPKAGLGIRI